MTNLFPVPDPNNPSYIHFLLKSITVTYYETPFSRILYLKLYFSHWGNIAYSGMYFKRHLCLMIFKELFANDYPEVLFKV